MKLPYSALARALVLILAAAPMQAHDYWMQPATFRPQKDALLEVGLFVGDFGRGDAVERDEKRIVKFLAATPEGEKKILGRDGATPAGFLRPKSDGVYVLGFQSNHASVVLEAEKFMAYLDERGLDNIKALRQARGETAKTAREIYSRSPKCIVQVGSGSADGWDRVLGLSLELTPRKDPHALARGAQALESLPIHLSFHGKPLAGALVAAMSLDSPPKDASDTTHLLHARTDSQGDAHFQLPRAGRWMVAAVHMLPLEHPVEADYESFWSSLTFEIQASAK